MESTLSCLQISFAVFLNQDVQGKIFDIINKALGYFMTSYYNCSNRARQNISKLYCSSMHTNYYNLTRQCVSSLLLQFSSYRI